MKPPIEKAVSLLGGQVALARALSSQTGMSVSQQRVWRWIRGSGLVPAEFCIAVEVATCGAVTRYELRPHDGHLIWPPAERRCADCPHGVASERDCRDG